MKLVRYGAIGQEKPGLIDKSGQLRDLSDHVKDLNGEAYAPASLAKLAGLDTAKLPAVSGHPRLGAPVTGISKFVAIGLNYVDHAKETGNQIPAEPIFFLKANTALSGPNDPVEKPRGSTKLDWEVEIAAIIGTRAKYVAEADALNHIAGYCVCNDVSERNFQIERMPLVGLDRGTPGERYILGGENLTLKQILDRMSAITGLPSPTMKVPHAVAMVFAFFDENFTGRLRGKDPRATVEAVRMGKKMMFASSAKAERDLGFQVLPVYNAMRSAIEWFIDNGYAPAI